MLAVWCRRCLALVFAVALGCNSDFGHQVGSCPDGQESCGGQCVAIGTCTGATCTGEGRTESCYPGPSSTLGTGTCTAGTRTCTGGQWSGCENAVGPVGEVCGNSTDEDCDGKVDEDTDEDNDGVTTCGGDCCDSPFAPCQVPGMVGPGAFEVAGNGVDDDCDGAIDNAASCDSGLLSNSGDAHDYARAMDICKEAPASGPGWGLVDATFSLADGSGTPASQSHSIRPRFGTGVQPLAGTSMAVLSTGHAAATNDSSPSFASFQRGQPMQTASQVPSDWLAANGGQLPNAPGCPRPDGGSTGYDPIMLTLQLRVPINAKSFALRSNFYSAEYPEWVCSPYNDFLVVLLDSSFAGTPANPADHNLAIYTAPGGDLYPVGVNLAYGGTGLFRQCVNGQTGCGDQAKSGSVSSCMATDQLAGTGFDVVNPPDVDNEPGYCTGSNLLGGATGWLETRGNVVPGETITLRIALWDTSDPIYDSLVLLDHFEWSTEGGTTGTGVIQ